MKYFILRKLYEFTFWFGDKVAPPESDINYGFYRKFRHPNEVSDHELADEIRKLGNAIIKAR